MNEKQVNKQQSQRNETLLYKCFIKVIPSRCCVAVEQVFVLLIVIFIFR